MMEWNESTLRGAASWQAFKEGKALWQSGAVASAQKGASGWQGAVRVGKRTLRVRVTVRSASDLETHCACPVNQSTGAVCAHAVAAGLAALQGGNGATEAGGTPSSGGKATAEAGRPWSWKVTVPPNWRESVYRGRLGATLEGRGTTAETTRADRSISGWLAALGVAAKPRLHLSLDGERLADFLEAIEGGEIAVAGAKGGRVEDSLEVRCGGRLEVAQCVREGNRVRIAPAAAEWIPLAGRYWQAGSKKLVRLGSPETVLDAAGERVLPTLATGRSAELSLSEFLAGLEQWQELLLFPTDVWMNDLHFVPAPFEVELALAGSLQEVGAELRVRYQEGNGIAPTAGEVEGLPRIQEDQCWVRDVARERQAVARLQAAGFSNLSVSSGRFQLKGEEQVTRFVAEVLPSLRRRWKVTEGERFERMRKQWVVVEPRLEILGSGEDWLDFQYQFQTEEGVTMDPAEVRRLLRAGGQGKNRDGKRIIISNDILNLLDPLLEELDIYQENGRYKATAAVGEVIRNLRENIGNNWKKSNLENNQTIDEAFALPLSVRASLRSYQTAGAAWLYDRSTRLGGALLADDMGLGKTLQTIACIERLFEESASKRSVEGLVLVVATTSLLGNWQAEFARFAPRRTVKILHGSGREKIQAELSPGEVVLTSFGTLARDLAWHLKQSYQAVVVDEASLMRNPDTDAAKALFKLNAAVRIALTGTPVENGVRDLWSIFRFLQPGWLGSREEFRERYELPSANPDLASVAMDRLKLKISPFVLRRTKEQVAPELPSKWFIEEFCDLTQEQQAVYRELLAEGRKRVETSHGSGQNAAARMQLLTALLRLRQTCCDLALLGGRFSEMALAKRSAKLQRLLELLEEAIAGGHRVLVFSQFQTQLLEIERCLRERQWESLRLDGQTRDRQELVDRFQRPEGPPVFLISLKAGGYGLNLTAADTVIHFDPWWNPAAEAQATDRAHRIGQTRPVTVYRLLTRGTVEEKVVRLQERKRGLASAIDESGASDGAGWSERELREMLG